MSEPYCPQHHPKTYRQCGCPLPKPPAKPLLGDVCKWCLICTYAAPFCRRLGHWRLINEEYESGLARWQETYGTMVAERRAEKSKPTPVNLNVEMPTATPRVSRPTLVVVLSQGVRDWLAGLGRRGG